ncbi:MAG: hypothetical protein JW727_03670 [Candidatus Aenigmarchaeota archaeon]|nr:hypothetical protein [Candidatus Aenigmarchaeota archaeon]
MTKEDYGAFIRDVAAHYGLRHPVGPLIRGRYFYPAWGFWKQGDDLEIHYIYPDFGLVSSGKIKNLRCRVKLSRKELKDYLSGLV